MASSRVARNFDRSLGIIGAISTETACDYHARTSCPKGTWALIAPPYDAYEIHGVAFVKAQGTICEPVEDANTELWTLYGHVSGHGVETMGNFRTREQAEAVFARITGRRYRDGPKS